MKKTKLWLLGGLLLLLAFACTVEERVVEKIVEKEITGAMESKPYGLSFAIDNEQFFMDDSYGFLDSYFYGQSSQYINDWQKRKMGSYKGPLTMIQGRGLLTGVSNASRTRMVQCFFNYETQAKSWMLGFGVKDGELEYTFGEVKINPDSLSIEFYKDDLYITFNEELTLQKRGRNGLISTAVLSKLFLKSKIVNSSEGDRSLGITIGHAAHLHLFMGKGVSRTQDIKLYFHEYTNLSNNLVQSMFYNPDAFAIMKKMDKSINYLYINGEKVFGSWDAEGQAFSYTPSLPYPANSKVDIIIPEEFTTLNGNRLAMPTFMTFTTGSSTIGMPDDLATPSNGEGLNMVELHWSQADPYNVVTHTIERADRQDGDFVAIDTVAPSDPQRLDGSFSYQDKTVDAGRSYYYRVIANGAGDLKSDYSLVVEGHALNIVPTAQ